MTPDSSVHLRPAYVDDALCLGVLGLQVFLDTYATGGIRPTLAREVLAQFSTAAMSASIARSAGGLWVAERDAHLVGRQLINPMLPRRPAPDSRPAATGTCATRGSTARRWPRPG